MCVGADRCFGQSKTWPFNAPLGVVRNLKPAAALPLVVEVCKMNRTAVSIFAVVLAVVVVIAFATTIHGVNTTQVASSEVPPGVSGLSQPHAPLDRAPGRAVSN